MSIPGQRKGEYTLTSKANSRLIGALFLAGFVVYGVGFGLVTSVIDAPDLISTVLAHKTTLILGAFLMMLNTVVDVGKGVLFFPILENHGKRTALAYLAALIVQVVLLDIGVLALLMLVPLGEYAIDAGAANAAWGLIGYTIHVAGAIAEIFGLHVSLILLIPGGLFELALGFWLLSKGIELRRPAVKSHDDPVILMAAA